MKYTENKHLILRLADWLIQYWPGSVVPLVTSDKCIITDFVYACEHINKAIFPINPELPVDRIECLLSQCKAQAVISDESELFTSSDIQCIRITAVYSSLLKNIKGNSGYMGQLKSIALVVATSGSTGLPKAVLLSTKAVNASANAVTHRLGLNQQSCWLNCLPLYHIGGLSILYRCAYVGAALVLHEKFDPKKVWNDLHRHSVSHISLVPAMLSKLLLISHNVKPPSSLHAVLIGGAMLSPTLARKAHDAGWPIVVSYGMTETSSVCALDDSADAGLVNGKVGQLLEGFYASIIGECQQIAISGQALMSGYASDEASCAMTDGYYLTGDSGWFDNKGILYIKGRIDDVLISGGKNIHPLEVEEQLEAYTGIGNVAVSSISDTVWGDKLVALFDSKDFTALDLQKWAKANLPSSICPRLFLAVERLPINTMGKLDRPKLKEICRHSYAEHEN